jgi:multidrug efflux pump subunit AcrA (membrane-fusion protein)
MNHPDGELPENWQGKPKDDAARSSIRRLWFAVGLLIFLLGIGVSVGIIRPDLLGALFPNVGQTQTAQALSVQQTQQALQATAQANAQAGTQAALNLQGTQSALDATQAAFNQAGTQAALDAIAARTSTVQAIQQRATTNALELQGTQAALNLSGTQAGLDVQSTLASLQDSNPTQVISDPIQATPTPTVSASASIIDDDFTAGISPGVWNFGATDWSEQGTGLIASADNSHLFTQRTDLIDYTLEVWFTPDSEGNVYLVHTVPNGISYGVRLYVGESSITDAALTMGTNSPLDTPLTLVAQTINAESGEYHVTLQMNRTQLTLRVNDQLMLDNPMNGVSAGAVGIILPNGTFLARVVITPS